jgi:CubicO group peptidase (beta-lactamase class C family)
LRAGNRRLEGARNCGGRDQDGKLLLARGYGVRELGKDAPIDETTIFHIASCTKSFTAAMVGKLVDQNKLRWDDPLSKHVPSLVVPTQGRAAKVTIRQALQHRTGLPIANMLWRSGEFDANEILRRVRFLIPVAAPGERLIYNNVMYLAVGKAVEHASGKSWSDFVKDEFFEPLGMKTSLAGSLTLRKFANLSEPHATIDGQVKAIERSNPDVIAPAGAIYSSAADMAQWLIMHLGRGRYRGQELLSAGRVDEMHTPVEPPPAKPSTKSVPKAPISRYGMGWFVNEHAGKRVVEHAGSGNGFVSWMAIMPKERLGVVILSNHKGTGINYALRFWIFDRLPGRPDFDWSSSVRKDYTQGGQRLLREAKAKFDAKRPPEKPPSQPLADYAGSFESRIYGTIQVTEKDGQLNLTFGTRFQGEFKPWQGDAFRVFFSNPRHHDWLVTFAVTGGKVASLRVQEAPWDPQWYDDRDDLGEFVRR